MASSNYTHEHPNQNKRNIIYTNEILYIYIKKIIAVAGDRTRVTRVTGGNTYHYTTTTLLISNRRVQFCMTLSTHEKENILLKEENILFLIKYNTLFF